MAEIDEDMEIEEVAKEEGEDESIIETFNRNFKGSF